MVKPQELNRTQESFLLNLAVNQTLLLPHFSYKFVQVVSKIYKQFHVPYFYPRVLPIGVTPDNTDGSCISQNAKTKEV